MSKISENILCAGDYMLDSAYAYGRVETETDMVIQIAPFLPHSFWCVGSGNEYYGKINEKN